MSGAPAMMDANFVCLFCSACYHRNRHRCVRECHVAGDTVRHFDICAKCQQILKDSFARQLRRSRLRVEGGSP